MSKNIHKKSIFIFRRDLRFYDNTALILASKNSLVTYPIFIFTPEQVSAVNKLKSDTAIQFMCQSLRELPCVSYFYGKPVKVLEDLVENKDIECIYVNEDYTPYSKQRDKEIKEMCKKKGIEFISCVDLMLQPDNLKKDGDPYLVFTPFYNNAKSKKVKEPEKYSNKECKDLKKISGKYSVMLNDIKKFYKENKNVILSGGRKEGLDILKGISKFKNYNKTRNCPFIPTTRLSAHLKFGTLSIREVYRVIVDKLGKRNELIKQLYWRDFYMVILNNFPELYKSATKPVMNKIRWKTNKKQLEAWKNGMTGVPLVDAGMREMNETGFMHNRVRMVVATFLIFNLGIYWKHGEEYFSQKLIDIDVSNNNGNWKWVAGIESFSNDYFRAFSMESQTKRFDPNGEYIKKWCPELKDVNPKHLADWEKYWQEYDVDYPKPIVDIFTTRKEMIELYKKTIKSA